jgi:uncharacterized membrane protein
MSTMDYTNLGSNGNGIADSMNDNFYTLAGSIIAGYGLLGGSETTVIGSMLISPIGGKIVEIVFKMLKNNDPTKSMTELMVMVVICVSVGYVMGTMIPIKSYPQTMVARFDWMEDFKQTKSALVTAVLGGMLLNMALAESSGLSSVAVGVGIATALLPPLVNAGLLYAVKDVVKARSSFNLYLVNLGGIAAGLYGMRMLPVSITKKLSIS